MYIRYRSTLCRSLYSFLSSSSLPSSTFISVRHHKYIRNRRFVRDRGQNQDEIDQAPTFQFAGAGDDKAVKAKHRTMVFTWGFSATGALGNECYMPRHRDPYDHTLPMPRKAMRKSPVKLRAIRINTTVHDVAAGAGFSVIAATEPNSPYVLYGCGLNTDSQIGLQLGGETDVSKTSSAKGEPLVCVANMVPIHLPIQGFDGKQNGEVMQSISNRSATKEKVIKVAAGRAHTLCLTNSGKVYSLGNNSYGQCGRPVVVDEKYFASNRIHCLTIPPNERVVNIVCGQDHSMLLMESGAVYTCGWGTDGQLGNGKFSKSCSTLTKVIGDIEGERIVSLSSAADCVLALNDKGQVFGWGNSEYHQLSMVTKETQVAESRHLQHLESIVGKTVSVGAGGSMCAVVNEDGAVFVWGFGHLGMGPEVTESRVPKMLNRNLFGQSIFTPNIKVKRIEAGLQHFAAITEKGDLYVWGKNTLANLGLGHEADMLFPFRVSLPGLVHKVSFGHDHTIAMVRTLH